MRSNEKSLLIDYFRKIPNKITCMIGDGQNDIEAIMSSHVGININSPINKIRFYAIFILLMEDYYVLKK